MKNMKITTFTRFGREEMRAYTYLLIAGTAFILLSGLRTLRALRAFKFTPPPMNSANPVSTTMKSMIFHPSLRYD